MTTLGTKVYVSWYGRTLEGEVLDGEWMGMKQVRIPLDGHHPVALFMPQHVYDSPEKLTETPESPSKAESDVVSLTPEQYVAKVYVTDLLQRFKASHWDEAHNHLRVDSLEEFYRLWREAMTPDDFVEAKTPASSLIRKVNNNKCQDCRYWEYTITLGSLNEPEWHCRDGFTPSKDCVNMAAYNDECMRKDPKQRPVDYKEKPQPSQKPTIHKIRKPAKAVELSLFD